MEINSVIRVMTFFMGIAMTMSCAESNVDAHQTATPHSQVSTATPALTSLDLSAYGTLDHIMVPARKSQGVDPSVDMDELSGYVSVRAGKNFQVIIREEPTTLQDLRQEMENEMMWSNEILSSDEQGMLIKRSLPDGSMSQFHFVAVVPGQIDNVVLRSDPMGEFSEKEASTMLHCAKTLKVSSPMTASNQ